MIVACVTDVCAQTGSRLEPSQITRLVTQIALFGGAALFLVGMALLYMVVVRPWWAWRRARRQTPEYQEEQRLAAIQRREQKELERQKYMVRRVAAEIRQRVIRSLTRQRMVWVYKRQNGMPRRMQRVDVRTLLYSLDEVWLRLDRLPFGVFWNDVVSDETLYNLRIDIGRKDAEFVVDEQAGVFVRVFLNSSIAGIPETFWWDDNDSTQTAFKLLPKRRPLAIPLGLGENRMFHWADLASEAHGGPHLLIAGQSGGGKTNFLFQMLATLLLRNTPDELQICLVDLKRVELIRFADVPHIWTPADDSDFPNVVRDHDDVPRLLKALRAELTRRYHLIEGARVNSIAAYNAIRRPVIPYLVVVFDEWAEFVRYADKSEANNLLGSLTALGRAAGIIVVLATQRPEVRVVTGDIKANMPGKLCFRMPNNASSITVIDRGLAAELPAIQGRAIWNTGGHYNAVQTPLIKLDQIGALAQRLQEEHPVTITDEEIFQRALDELHGKFGIADNYTLWDGQVSQHRLRKLAKAAMYDPEQQSPVLWVNGQRVIMTKVADARRGKGATRPYWLLPVNGELPASQEAAQEIFRLTVLAADNTHEE